MNFAKTSLILSTAMLWSVASAVAQVTVEPSGNSSETPATGKASAASSTVNPVEDPRITATKLRYNFSRWAPAGAAHDGVEILDLKLPKLKQSSLEISELLPTLQNFASADGKNRVVVTWGIYSTAQRARAELLANLTAVNSPKLLPTTRSAGIEAGDMGFIGYSREGRISWIAFTRGNISVRVNCLDPRVTPHLDLSKIAERVDQLIQIQPLLKDGDPLHQPTALRFEANRNQCAAGDWIELDLQANHIIKTEWQLSGSAQGYVEKRDGRWMLRVTGPGTLNVNALLMGQNGVIAKTAALEILVTDDD